MGTKIVLPEDTGFDYKDLHIIGNDNDLPTYYVYCEWKPVKRCFVQVLDMMSSFGRNEVLESIVPKTRSEMIEWFELKKKEYIIRCNGKVVDQPLNAHLWRKK